MNTRLLALGVGSLLALGAAADTRARAEGERSDHGFEARLTGYPEVPPISTRGRGDFSAQIVPHEGSVALRFRLRYAGLEGGAVRAAHIHFGQRGVNGGVSAFLCGGPKPACPDSPGTIAGLLTASDVIGPAHQGIAPGELGELLRAMRLGVTYVNAHTAAFEDGEIRGQISSEGE